MKRFFLLTIVMTILFSLSAYAAEKGEFSVAKYRSKDLQIFDLYYALDYKIKAHEKVDKI